MATALDSVADTNDILRSLGIDIDVSMSDFRLTADKSKAKAEIVIIGRAGSGKSAIINALCGAVVMDAAGEPATLPANEGNKLRHETDTMSSYVARQTTVTAEAMGEGKMAKNFSVIVWDSPGLFDGEDKDKGYIKEVKEKCKPDLLLYCIDMSQRRCIVQEMVIGMKMVTDILGPEVWKYAIIVLTFANKVKPKQRSPTDIEIKQHFYKTFDHWVGKVREALTISGVDDIAAQKITIEAAGSYREPNLPDRIHWLGYLWLKIMHCSNPEAKFSILINTQDRVNNSEYLVVDEHEHAFVIDTFFGQLKKFIISLARKKQKCTLQKD